jgi:hypothetical protein
VFVFETPPPLDNVVGVPSFELLQFCDVAIRDA